MCLEKDMLSSKRTPRFRTTEDGEIVLPENVIEEDKIFCCCCGVPINKYSVFEGLTDRRLECNQAKTESSVDERQERLFTESVLENEM